MKPFYHGKVSVSKWGGVEEDYQEIHDFLDSSKAHVPDMRHRAILHSSFGIFIAERVFGTYIVNSDGNKIMVRDIAEQHVIDDLGTIPTVQDYLEHLPMLDWLGGPKRKPKKKMHLNFDLDDTAEKHTPSAPINPTPPPPEPIQHNNETNYLD